jgi:hypothetical protein
MGSSKHRSKARRTNSGRDPGRDDHDGDRRFTIDQSASLSLPSIVARSGRRVQGEFLSFFAGEIANENTREHGVGVQTIYGRRERFGGPSSASARPFKKRTGSNQDLSFRSPPGFVETTTPHPGFGIPPTPSLRSRRPFGPGSRTADPSPRVRRNARTQGSAFRRPLRSGLFGPLGLGVVPPTPYPGLVVPLATRVRRLADPFAPVFSALWAWESYRRPLTQGSSFRSPPGFGIPPTPSLRSHRPLGPGSRTADPLPRARRSARHQGSAFRRPLTQGSALRRPLRSGLFGPLGLGVVPPTPYPGFGVWPTPSLRSFRPFGPGSRTADPSPRVRRNARHQGSAFRRPLRSGLLGPLGLGATGFVHDHAPGLETARGFLTVSSARRRAARDIGLRPEPSVF